MDIVFSILILAGIAMVVIARVLMHKGMWNLRDDSINFSHRRGIETPYDLARMGVIFFCMGVATAVGHYFGLKAGGLTFSALGLATLVYSYFWLKRVDREDADEYNSVIIALIASGCAIAIGLFVAWEA